VATRRTVDLGTVGFGLVPNTAALEASLAQLRKFGQTVERLGADTDAVVQKQYAKFAQIERILATLHTRVSATTQRMRESGVAVAEIDKVDQAYRRLTNTVIRNADAINRSQLARGVVGMNAIIGRGNRMAGAAEASRMVVAFRDLERAAILMVGPLSGIGARLAVMAALFESTTAAMALFVAGTAGVVAGISYLASASVKAVIDQQRFDAQLTASTGAAALAGDAYQFVLDVANRLGQNVRDLVEPYAKFTTAARLSNVPLVEQRKIFEGAVIAGTAMRLNGERMGLVFLALEQMFSKGIVTMEELRRQLGDLLPGSFGLAAKAMGVSEAQLTKMLKSGDVLAKDLLPRLAELWVKTFGPAAQQAAVSLQGQTQLLGTALFELEKRFDSATGFSELWRRVLVDTRQVLEFLTANMERTVAVFGALAGAGAGLAVLAIFSRLPAIITATATALRTLTAAVLAMDLALIATGWGAILKALAKVAVVAIGAAAGYALLKREIDPAADAAKQWAEQTEAWIQTQENIGKSHKQTTEELKKGTQERLQATITEITAIQARITALTAEQKARTDALKIKPSAAVPFGSLFLEPLTGESADVKSQRQRLEALEQLRTQLESVLTRLGKLSVEVVPPPGQEASTQWQTWAEKVQQSIRSVTALGEQLKAADFGKTAMDQAEAMGKAIEFMADQPKKGRGNIQSLVVSLRQAGFEGKSLTEQLAAMFLLIEQRKESIKEIEAFPAKLRTLSEQFTKMFEKIDARKRAAIFGDPEELSSAKQLELQIVTLVGIMEKMKFTQEQVNFFVGEFRRQWEEMANAEAGSKEIKRINQELEKLDNQLGSKGERAIERFEDRLELLNEALALNALSYELYAEKVKAITADMYRTTIDQSTIFGKSVKDAFRDLERGSSEILARMSMGLKIEWKDLFNSLLEEALTFFYRITVIQPIMKGLFGGLYTQRSGDVGTGVFESFMRSFMPAPQAAIAPIPANAYGGFAAPFQHGGSFMVGGSGGTDSQLVSFRATPNERVDVLTPEQQRMSGGGNLAVKVIVRNETGVPMEATQGPITFDGEGAIMEMFFRRLKRDGIARDRLRQLTARPT